MLILGDINVRAVVHTTNGLVDLYGREAINLMTMTNDCLLEF